MTICARLTEILLVTGLASVARSPVVSVVHVLPASMRRPEYLGTGLAFESAVVVGHLDETEESRGSYTRCAAVLLRNRGGGQLCEKFKWDLYPS